MGQNLSSTEQQQNPTEPTNDNQQSNHEEQPISSIGKSRSSNNFQQNSGAKNHLSKSIPNLKDLKNIEQVGNMSSRGLDYTNNQYQSQMEKSKDVHYKKNLYSAMTTRVIKQQENAAASSTNLNKSQILQLTSQRSMTHLNSIQSKAQGGSQNNISFLKQANATQSVNMTPVIAVYENNQLFSQDGEVGSRNRFQQHNVIISQQMQLSQNYSENQMQRRMIIGSNDNLDSFQDNSYQTNGIMSNEQQRMHTQQQNRNQDMPRIYQPGAAPTLDLQLNKPPSEGRHYNKPLSTQGIPSKQRPAGGAVLPSSNSFMENESSMRNHQQRLTPNAQYHLSKNDKPFLSKDQQQVFNHQKMFSSQRTSFDYTAQGQKRTDNKPSSASIYQSIKNAGQQYLMPQALVSNQNSASRSGNMPPLPYKIRIKNTHADTQIGAASSRMQAPPTSTSPNQTATNINQSGFQSLFTTPPVRNQSLLIKRFIQFGGQNCPLDSQIVITLLLFDMPNFRKYLCLSPQWHRLVLDAMDDYFKAVETSFVIKNYEYLLFKKSYTNSSVIQFCGRKGIRVDRVIQCEILENAFIMNKCLRISYSYQYASQSDDGYVKRRAKEVRKNKQTFIADFKFDIVKPGVNRIVWIHKDEQEQFNQLKQFPSIGEDLQEILKRPYVQPITQICAKDTIEIALNLYSLQGLVDIESIEWLDCTVTTPTQQNVVSYIKDMGHSQSDDLAQKIFCDMSRICELEDAVVEWYDSRYFQRPDELLNIDFLKELFKITKYECAGIDGTICKIQLSALRSGRLYNPMIGIPIVVKDTNNQGNSSRKTIHAEENTIVNEVKKLGLLIDRYVDLELRTGDTLVIYISRGGSM